MRNVGEGQHKLLIIEMECPTIPRRGWAETRRKVYEVDPLLCPHGGGQTCLISFIKDYSVVDRIINHLKLTFVAERPPPPLVISQQILLDSEDPADYFFIIFPLARRRGPLDFQHFPGISCGF